MCRRGTSLWLPHRSHWCTPRTHKHFTALVTPDPMCVPMYKHHAGGLWLAHTTTAGLGLVDVWAGAHWAAQESYLGSWARFARRAPSDAGVLSRIVTE